MAEEKVTVMEDKTEKPKGNGGKKKIIVIAIVIIVIIAVIAFVLLQGDDDGNGNGGNGNGNNPPHVEIDLIQTDFYVNRTIYFNCTYTDPDGDELNFLWEFDDGDTDNDANTTHMYTIPGTYNVTITVTDEHDESDEDDVTITVKNVPVVDLSVDRTQIPTQPPVYTVTVDGISHSIAAELVHFYVIDGASQNILIEGNVADYEYPHTQGYVLYFDDGNGNISDGDTFTISDQGSLNPLGIDDGDIFKLTMEGSDDFMGQISLE